MKALVDDDALDAIDIDEDVALATRKVALLELHAELLDDEHRFCECRLSAMMIENE